MDIENIRNRQQSVDFLDGYTQLRKDELYSRKLTKGLVKSYLLETVPTSDGSSSKPCRFTFNSCMFSKIDGNSGDRFMSYEGADKIATVDSCYFDGNNVAVVNCLARRCETLTYRYCCLVNMPDFSVIVDIGSAVDDGNNLINNLNPSQVTSIHEITEINPLVQNDLKPIGGSILLGVGHPGLIAYDLFNVTRSLLAPNIGAVEGGSIPPATSLSYFDQASVINGSYAVSTIRKDALVTAIQSDSTDLYFDSASKIGKVYVYYNHEAGRQDKLLVHRIVGDTLFSSTSWSSFARDGTWQKTRIKAFDFDGATHDLYRNIIGTGEDITHLDGTTFLNT